MAKVAAINISEIRGIQKHEIPEAYLKEGWGIEGDAHAGNWHRQVSLLSSRLHRRNLKRLPVRNAGHNSRMMPSSA